MRKLLLASSILLLASCTEQEKETAESETKIETSTNEQQEEQEESNFVPNELYIKQLSNVIGSIAEKYDFLPNDHVFFDYINTSGLVYAELFDANADGQNELYVLFKSNSYIEDELSHRNQDGYIQEIWQANANDDAATLLHYDVVEKDPALIGQTAAILKSGLDEHEFIIDLQTTAQSLKGVMDKLSAPMNSYTTNNEIVENDIVAQVDNVIQDLKMFGTVDTRDRKAYQRLATSLILYGLVKPDAPPYSYFVGFEEETINAELQKRFNITLTADDIDLPKPSEEDTTNFFTYKDGVFYIPPSDYYSKKVFRTTENVMKVSDDVYYARIEEFHFDSMGYMDITHDYDFNFEQLNDTPIEKWPAEAKPFLIPVLPVYAVVKIVDGDAKLMYQGFVNLTDEELEGF